MAGLRDAVAEAQEPRLVGEGLQAMTVDAGDEQVDAGRTDIDGGPDWQRVGLGGRAHPGSDVAELRHRGGRQASESGGVAERVLRGRGFAGASEAEASAAADRARGASFAVRRRLDRAVLEDEPPRDACSSSASGAARTSPSPAGTAACASFSAASITASPPVCATSPAFVAADATTGATREARGVAPPFLPLPFAVAALSSVL